MSAPTLRPRRRRAALALESLETRLAPACRVSLAPPTGLLSVGCDGANDNVVLTYIPPEAIVVIHNGVTERFPLPGVRSIAVDTAAGDDMVSLTNVVRSADVRLGDGNDTLDAHDLGAATAVLRVNVNGDNGNDTFNIAPRSQNLNTIQAMLAIDGGPSPGPARFQDTLTINDQNGSSSTGRLEYQLTEARLTRRSFPGLDYQHIAALRLSTSQLPDEITVDLGPPRDPMNMTGTVAVDAGAGDDFVSVERVAPTWALTADGSRGADTFLVSPTAQDLNTIRGRLTVDGGALAGAASQDALVIYDENAADPTRLGSYTVTSAAATRGAAGAAVAVNYRNFGYLQVDTSNNADLIRLELASRLPSFVYIVSGAGDDVIQPVLLPPAGGLYLDGGRGGDTLDYSQLRATSLTGVYVDLAGGGATGVDYFVEFEHATGGPAADYLIGDANGNRLSGGGGGDALLGGAGDDYLDAGAGDDYAVGEDGNDIVLGGDGGDWLEGGAGRDLVFGGRGGDAIFGGDDDDIVLGGVTRYDGIRVALEAILGVWTSRLDYATRVDMIYNGQVTGGYQLNERTVFADEGGNYVGGDGGMDWFFLDELDVGDPEEGEVVVLI